MEIRVKKKQTILKISIHNIATELLISDKS